MKYATRILIPLLVSIALHPAAVFLGVAASEQVDPSQAPIEVPDPGRLAMFEATPIAPGTITGGSVEQRALVSWALEQYENAGLNLPRLQFRLRPDETFCGGNRGFFSHGSEPWLITICAKDRMVFLHEIGHAWAEYTLTTSERYAYVKQRGMESWNDSDTGWGARGSEDAANTLAWGLVDDPIRGMMEDGPIAERNRAFRLLAGIDSPRVITG